MVELVGKNKVYSEFLTNLAVAWFAAGIISSLYAGSENPTKTLVSVVSGVLGTWASLKLAIPWSKGDKK